MKVYLNNFGFYFLTRYRVRSICLDANDGYPGRNFRTCRIEVVGIKVARQGDGLKITL